MASAETVRVARAPAARDGPRLALAPPTQERERIAAVVDLGSNSWRLVVYAFAPGASWRCVGALQEPVRIAEGLSRSGRLGEPAIARGLETLDLFARYCDARGIAPDAVDVVATSAIRDATNGAEVVVQARERTGFAIDVLSSEQEAHFGYLAAVNSSTLTDGAVIDLGGGSLQLVAVEDRRERAAGSWPLGAVRVTERLLPGDGAVSRKQLKRARATVREELAGASWLGATGRHVVAMGGAVRNLAAAAQRIRGAGATGIQGYVLTSDDLRALVQSLAKRPPSQRALPGIKAARGDIVLGAAVVLEALLDLGGFDGIEITRAGLREGVFFHRRLLAGAAEPLLGDVRAASIRNLALQCDADIEHADHVANLALQLHDSLAAAKVIAPACDERELLWAAAQLHDIGITIGYDGRHGHSHYVILNGGLAAYGPREVALIAQIVRHHRKGTPDLGDLRRYVHAGDADLLSRCALLLRLAEQLERGQDGSVREARLVPEQRALRLCLERDDRLARWSLERQLSDDAYRRVFGRRVILTP
jgi:exopolyphosphatase/guanosine-5'-triphosphate,3'-diphosphate pyrophosphatase